MPNGREGPISLQPWAKNATLVNADATTLDITRCVTHHDHAPLMRGGGCFVHTLPLDNHNILTLQHAPGYTEFTEYCTAVGYDPFSQ